MLGSRAPIQQHTQHKVALIRWFLAVETSKRLTERNLGGPAQRQREFLLSRPDSHSRTSLPHSLMPGV